MQFIKNKTAVIILGLLLVFSSSALAANNSVLADKTTKNNTNDGVIIFKDATGGSVLHNMPGEVWATPEESQEQHDFLQKELNSKDELVQETVYAISDHYDTENDPVLIGH